MTGFGVLTDEEADIKPAKRKMATTLVDRMAGDFDPDVDDDESAAQELVQARLNGREVIPVAEV